VPELPPPPPPPLSIAGVVADATRRALAARTPARAARPLEPAVVSGSGSGGAADDLVPGASSPGPSPLAAVAPPLLLVCAALALVVVGGWFLLQRFTGGSAPPEITLPRATPSATAAAADPSLDPDAPAPSSADAAGDTASTAAERPRGPVTVHAAGAVARPGVYRLPPGARVADLIQAAGGATADAEVDALNLAALLGDGRRVYVPHRGELPPGALLAAGDVGDGTLAGSGPGPPARPVDLNTATLEQLDALPGVGPTTAQAILDYRRTNGRFRSVDELLEVRGIGPSRLEALRKRVRV